MALTLAQRVKEAKIKADREKAERMRETALNKAAKGTLTVAEGDATLLEMAKQGIMFGQGEKKG